MSGEKAAIMKTPNKVVLESNTIFQEVEVE
jgi:hypothetical protein